MEDWIVHGPREGKRVPKVSLGEHYLAQLTEHGDKVALVQQVNGLDVTVTYTELLRRGKMVAGLLRQRGLGSGDTVMLCCGNTLEFPPVMLGALFVGAALAPVNPDIDLHDMRHLLGEVQPQCIISVASSESRVHAALADHKPPVAFVSMATVVSSWTEQRSVDEFHLSRVDDVDSCVALVMSSSGTSGRPKSVEITHLRWLSLLYLDAFPEGDPGKPTVVLNMAGPFGITCQMLTLFALCSGHKLALLEKFSVEAYFNCIYQYKVTLTMVGPEQLMAVAQYPSTEHCDLLSLRTVIYTGSAMRQPMLELAEKKLRCPIIIMYALTECAGHVRPAYDVYYKPGSCGKLADRMTAKVVDIETGKPVGPGTEGELCFKSPTQFRAYRNNPEATMERFDKDGFLHTGDIGYFDKDEFFYVNDRIKELFKYRGTHVSGVDIEEVLLQHHAVLEAAVIGVPHEVDCTHATAFVVQRQDMNVTDQDLVEMVKEKLPAYKWLYGGIRFVDSLPKTASGKVQKYELRKLAQG